MAADTYASLSDLRVASLMNMEIRELLHEPTDLRLTMLEMPMQAGMGSVALKSGGIDPVDAFVASGEDTATSVVNITDNSATLTPAHYKLPREITDLAMLTGQPGIQVLADSMVKSANYTLSSLVTTAFASLATSVGSTGVDLDVDDIYSALYSLELNLVSGPFYCVLHPRQWADLQASLRGEGGVMGFQQATADMLALKGPGYKGMWNGIEFYTHDSCPTANGGADRVGALYGHGCFGYTELPVDQMSNFAQGVVPVGSKLFVEIARGSVGSQAGKTFITGHYFPAVAELEDLRGVKIVTDA